MKEEQKKHPEAKENSQEEGEVTPSKTAPADNQQGDDVQGYGEPTDASGGGGR